MSGGAPSAAASGAPRPAAIAGAVACGAAALLAAFVVYLSGGPLHTDDMWFHLRLGEHFVAFGLASGFDPILHTAHARDPVLHEWLFGVLAHGVDRVGGLAGLRLAHALAVAASLALVFSLLRRERAGAAALGLAMAVFVALSWWRLHQLRPDLVTIPFTFLMFRWLLEDRTPPSWTRVAAAAALLGLWANLHAGFLVGLALLLAATLGSALHAAALAWWVRDGAGARAQAALTARRAGALALCALATLLNPRGLDQHRTFWLMREGGVMPAQDEWPGFDPTGYVELGGQLGRFEWIVTEALLAAFLVVAAVAGVRALRARSADALADFDPARLGLALASCVALIVTVRTNWLCVFPLLYLLHAMRHGPGLPARWRAPADLALAALAALVATGFFAGARYAQFAETSPEVWRSRMLSPAKYAQVTGVLEFLLDTGVEGNLFNAYHTGAFYGYWLAPRVRSFIDGRNEAYPAEVFHDYSRVIRRRGAARGETHLDVLDRRDVDLFVGTGFPFGRGLTELRPFTTSHVEGAPGWIPVFRAVGQSIHLRDVPRNQENLARIAAWYEAQGVPFDPARGLDVDRVIRERPDWAEAHQLLPLGFAALREQAEAGSGRARAEALQRSALYLALAGAWGHEVEVERAILEIAPGAIGARRRLVHALLRLGRIDEAVGEADALAEAAPRDAASTLFVRAARRAALARRRGDGPADLELLPLLDPATAAALVAGRYRSLDLDLGARHATVAERWKGARG